MIGQCVLPLCCCVHFLGMSLKHKLWSTDVHPLLLTGVIPWSSSSCLRHSLLAKPRLFFCLQFDTFNFCIWVFDICWINLSLLWCVCMSVHLYVCCRVHVEVRVQFCRARCLHPPWIRDWTVILHHAQSLYLPSHLAKLQVNFCRWVEAGFSPPLFLTNTHSPWHHRLNSPSRVLPCTIVKDQWFLLDPSIPLGCMSVLYSTGLTTAVCGEFWDWAVWAPGFVHLSKAAVLLLLVALHLLVGFRASLTLSEEKKKVGVAQAVGNPAS